MFKLIKVFALALSLVATTLMAGEVPEMSQQQLLEALTVSNNNIVLLDVRSKDEYDEGHVAGAINISHNAIKDNLALLAQYKTKKVVVYCRSGRRAAFAENILAENGFTNLHHLTGDMNGWIEAELPVVVGEGK
jgi:rhodanese-related sulfurtransferase